MTPEIASHITDMADAYNGSLMEQSTLWLIVGLGIAALVLCLAGLATLLRRTTGSAVAALVMFVIAIAAIAPAGYMAYQNQQQREAAMAVAETHCAPVLDSVRAGQMRYLPDDMTDFFKQVCGESEFLVAFNAGALVN